MKYKRFFRINGQYKYYEKKELLKVQTVSIYKQLLNKSLKASFLHKIYVKNRLKPRYGLRNCCIVSGRARNLNKQFNVSRIMLRNLNLNRIFSGLRKISW